MPLSVLLLAVLLLQAATASPHVAVTHNTSDLVTVHVLEKCCPFATRFEVGDYTSQLQQDIEWRLTLSFQAFKFSRAALSGRKCWKIEDIVAGDSQGLHVLGADVDPDPQD